MTENTLLWLHTVLYFSVFDIRLCRLIVMHKVLEEPRFSVELEAVGSAGFLEVTFQQATSNAPNYKAS